MRLKKDEERRKQLRGAGPAQIVFYDKPALGAAK